MFQRDRYVIEIAQKIGASVIVTLGGGYNRAAWQVTANFLRWLLQDPTSSFSLRRPPLPGQKHPGLGMVREVMEFFASEPYRRARTDAVAVTLAEINIAESAHDLGAPAFRDDATTTPQP